MSEEFPLLRVDLAQRHIGSIQAPSEYTDTFWGGSGLAFRLIAGQPVSVGALDPEAKLMFVAGLLTGTAVPTACKGSVVARSPLTGLFSESTVGGFWPRRLRGSGYGGLIIEGRAEEPVYLYVRPDGAEICSASELWGLDTHDTTDALRSETHESAEVACIGPAGENLVPFAAVIIGGTDARAAGRTGMGAVMGSKNLKAVVVTGDVRPEVADPEEIRKVTAELLPAIREGTQLLRDYGTAGGVQSVEHSGDLPIKNWRAGSWHQGAAATCGQRLVRDMLSRHYACYGCPIRCGKDLQVPMGPHRGTVSSGPEYETCAAFGSMVLNDDAEVLVAANDLANRLGLDTITTGAALAFAMECSEKRLIRESVPWGDGRIILNLLEDIAYRRGLGETLALGTRAAAEQIGGTAPEYVVDCKGLDVAYHDPRAFTSMAVNYATAVRGGCHLEGLTYFVEGGSFSGSSIGLSDRWDRTATEGKAELTVVMQNYLGTFNALGLCKFLLRGGIGPSEVARWVSAVIGRGVTPEELMTTGERIFNLKRLVNARLGVSRKDDTLPPRLLTHPRPSGGAEGVLPHLGRMLSEYYRIRGWTEEGLPTTETCERLQLAALT